jgi:hypothetical protein
MPCDSPQACHFAALVGLGLAACRPKFQRAILWTAWLGVAVCVVLRARITELLLGGLFSAFFH